MSPAVVGRVGPPAELTSLVGRQREQAQTMELLAHHRLVTLTGGGGIGKTRLAITSGTRALSHVSRPSLVRRVGRNHRAR